MFCNGLPHEFVRRNSDNGAGGGGGNPPPTDDQEHNGANGTPPTGLTEEQWKLAFEHPRFKDILKRAKDAETLLEKQKSDAAAAEQARLKEQNDFKALWEKAEADKAAALAETERVKAERLADAKRAALVAEAQKQSFHPQAAQNAHRFIDLAALPVSDAGAVDAAAVEKAIKALAEAQPYMLGNGQRQDPGSPPNRNGGQPPTEQQRADFERVLRGQIIR